MFQLTDFHYALPPELIAQYPLPRRGDSRLLILGADGIPQDSRFQRLPDLLNPGDLLVCNDTRVIPARLRGRKDSGGQVEILVERLLDEQRMLAQIRASKSPRPASRILLEPGTALEVLGRDEDFYQLASLGEPLPRLLERLGHIPLPPYINRADEVQDRERYQTLYAAQPGAVAAPTAGLHFDQDLLDRLLARGVAMARVTLHVGAGTFQPVRTQNLDQHRMHAEWLQVSAQVCGQVREAQARGGRVVAVGTTSVRALETAAASGELKPYQGDTRLFIRPGYPFRVVDRLITNFHLPESTLLMLVAALGGHAQVLAAYRHAVQAGYRFFSYGDAMLVDKSPWGI